MESNVHNNLADPDSNRDRPDSSNVPDGGHTVVLWEKQVDLDRLTTVRHGCRQSTGIIAA
jgi:hypothetical protein